MYADDLALLVAGENLEEVRHMAHENLRLIAEWMEAMALELTGEKMELVILRGRNDCGQLRLQLGGLSIAPKRAATYLGILFGK